MIAFQILTFISFIVDQNEKISRWYIQKSLECYVGRIVLNIEAMDEEDQKENIEDSIRMNENVFIGALHRRRQL